MDATSDNGDHELAESLASLGMGSISNQAGGSKAVENQQSYRCSIFLLPDDIFLRIITTATRTDVSIKPKERQATLLSISQVCRWWRQDALACKPLWSSCIDYNNDSLTWIGELLQRSSPSLMDFGTFSRPFLFASERPDSSVQTQILNRVLREIQRIRVFSYFSDEDSHWDVIFSSFHQRHLPFPWRRSIFFRTESTAAAQASIAHSPITLNAPRLQHICLGRPSIDHIPLLALRNLQNLRIMPGGLRIDYGDWLNLLHNLPNLRWLTICDVLAEGTSRPSEISKVRLDHLQMLVLAGSVTISLDFLELLVLPPKCSLQLEITDRGELPPSSENRIAHYMTAVVKSRSRFTRKISMFHSHIYELAYVGEVDMPSSSGEISNTNGIQVTPATYQSDLPFNIFGMYIPPATVSVPLLTLRRVGPANFPLLLTFLTLLSSDYTDVTKLDIFFDSDRDLAPDEGRLLAEKFRAFENLTSLRFIGGADASILPILRQSTESPLFPLLKSISFKDTGSLSPTGAEVIKDFLQWRIGLGLPIGTIYVVYYGSDPLERTEEFFKLIGFDRQEEGFAEKYNALQTTEDLVFF